MSVNRTIHISQPCLSDDEWLSLKEPIETGWLTQGPKVAEFEYKFAELHQVKYAIATTSCTTGLHLILAALGVGPGDEVIIPAFTWVATANVVMYCGAKPVFVDVDANTYNIDPAKIAEKITNRTKAIIPVHLFGLCADIDEIKRVAPGIPLVEDAACAAAGMYKGKFAGSLGVAGAFSFHPRKSITTGEGGMVTTNDEALAERMIQLRNHGASISEEQRHAGPRPYILPDFNILGYNYRMTDLQGAVGLVQIKKLIQFIDERARWAAYYKECLKNISWLNLPEEPADGRHAWQAYVTSIKTTKAPMTRNEIMERLQERGIATRPGTHAIHMLNYYKELYGFRSDDFPNARNCDQNSMAIPLHNCMSEEDYEYVVRNLKRIDT